MISYETYCRIMKYATDDKLNIAQIAKECNLSWLTVSQWLKKGRYERPKRQARFSKLSEYKNLVKGLLEQHEYTIQQVYQKLKTAGYQGTYTPVRTYVNLVRPVQHKAYLTLSFTPGECAQVDWGSFGTVMVGNTVRKLYFFVMVLCYSRMLYLEFTVSQTTEHFLSCHQKGFEFFGGVPAKVMIDNLKTGVIRHSVGQAPIFNSRYLDFAHHYGFEPVACNPRKGNEKGRVENGVGYVKKNFLNGLIIKDFAHLHPAASCWLSEVANVRIHKETGKKPCDMFLEEKKALKALPFNPHDIASVVSRRATSRFRISLESNHYSVPAKYALQKLIVRIYPDRICIYCSQSLIATHPRSYEQNQDFENPEHVKDLLEYRHNAKEQKIFASFLSICPQADKYYKELSIQKCNSLHHIRKIVALFEIYGQENTARAINDALELGVYGSEYIYNILTTRSRLVQPTGALILTRSQDLLDIELQKPDLSIYEKKN